MLQPDLQSAMAIKPRIEELEAQLALCRAARQEIDRRAADSLQLAAS